MLNDAAPGKYANAVRRLHLIPGKRRGVRGAQMHRRLGHGGLRQAMRAGDAWDLRCLSACGDAHGAHAIDALPAGGDI